MAKNKEIIPAVQLFLRESTFEGNVAAIRFCLEGGASPSYPDDYGTTPLHIAAQKGFFNIVKLLLAYNATSTLDSLAQSPQKLALQNGHYEIAKLLHFEQVSENLIGENELG